MEYRHQLNIHLDYGPQCFQVGGLEVRYGYHYSGEHQLREQVMLIPEERLEPGLRADLDQIYAALAGRIPEPDVVRLPHAEIRPTIRTTGLTFVVLDQTRAVQLPIARLYYIEEVPEVGSSIERRVYIEQPHWTVEEREVCDRVRQRVRKLAWEDYSRLIGHHLFGSAEGGV
jgi:hypothetical protein